MSTNGIFEKPTFHPEMAKGEVIIGIHCKDIFYTCCPIEGARKLEDVHLGPGRILTAPWFTLVANHYQVEKAGRAALDSWPIAKEFKLAVGDNGGTKTRLTSLPAKLAEPVTIAHHEPRGTEIVKDVGGEVSVAEGVVAPEPAEANDNEIPVPSHIGGPPVVKTDEVQVGTGDSSPVVKKRKTRGPGKKTLERMRLAGLLPTAGNSTGSGNGKLTFKKMWDPKNPTNEVDFVIKIDCSYPLRDIEDPKNRGSDEFYSPGVYRLKRAKCPAAATERFPEGTEWYVGKHGHGLPFALMQILESMPRYGHELDVEIRAVE